MSGVRRLLIVCAFAIVLWGGEYGRRHLWEPDEARYAYLAREMRETGEWAVMHRHGELYPDKPPVMFWMINVSSLLTGGRITSVSARLPSLLGAILSLWVTIALMSRWRDEKTGWRAGLILATSYLFWKLGGMGQIDSLLCGLEMMAFYLLVTDVPRTLWRPALAYAFMGVAVITKGPVGLVVPLGAYAVAMAASGQKAELKRFHWLWGLLIVAAFPAAWLLWAWLSGGPPEYFQNVVFGQTSKRVMEGTGHSAPFWYYLMHFPLEFAPWTLVLPAALAALWKDEGATRLRRFLLGWMLFVIVFFSLPTDKRQLYILFAYPPAAMLVAAGWDGIKSLARGWTAAVAGATVVLMLVLAAASAVLTSWEDLPVTPHALWPWGVIMGAGAVALALIYLKDNLSPRWFYCLAIVLLLHQLYIGNIIYPAANDIKTPVELAAVAKERLAPGQRLIIFRMHGEIQALYAERRGLRVDDVSELKASMKEQGRGLVVMGQQVWDAIEEDVGDLVVPHSYRMGHKSLVWGEFDLAKPAGRMPPKETLQDPGGE